MLAGLALIFFLQSRKKQEEICSASFSTPRTQQQDADSRSQAVAGTRNSLKPGKPLITKVKEMDTWRPHLAPPLDDVAPRDAPSLHRWTRTSPWTVFCDTNSSMPIFRSKYRSLSRLARTSSRGFKLLIRHSRREPAPRPKRLAARSDAGIGTNPERWISLRHHDPRRSPSPRPRRRRVMRRHVLASLQLAPDHIKAIPRSNQGPRLPGRFRARPAEPRRRRAPAARRLGACSRRGPWPAQPAPAVLGTPPLPGERRTPGQSRRPASDLLRRRTAPLRRNRQFSLAVHPEVQAQLRPPGGPPAAR